MSEDGGGYPLLLPPPEIFCVMPQPIRLAFIVLVIQWDLAVCLTAEPRGLEFNRDIRPILSDHCFACHGPDKNKREADVRLDTEQGLFDSDAAPVVRGDPSASTLVQRIASDDVDERMPPADFGKDLSSEQIELLRQWIAQGADWQGHWSFQPIRRPEPPSGNRDDRDASTGSAAELTNPVDAFVVEVLQANGLALSTPADRRTLARRLHFDLLGLPPTPEVVERFEHSDDPLAYEQMVDELLASPHFGERMAIWWLDLVRYADSVGYHGDQPVSVSPFRDYVIDSFNNNKPFDRFTIEQLAGDLLPEPTLEQRIAAGYNRLGMMSAEGGVQPKEYLAKYIAERVRNLGGTWLGITLGCCECHDHKFDPFSAKDFYQFEAFFADIEERGLYGGADWGPKISLPSAEQQARLATLDADIANSRDSLNKPTEELARGQIAWEANPTHELPPELGEILMIARDARTPEQAEQLAAHYRSLAPELAPLRERLKQLEAEREQLSQSIPSMLATKTVEPRMVRVLARGNWMDDSGIEVRPAIPALLGGDRFNASCAAADDIESSNAGELKRRLNRLDLAEWVVAKENPLTARVAVNRLWKLFFGAGLSSKLDDLGAQGEWPSHPELLDWLADEFRTSGWNVKHIVKLMVMSDAYRQDSFAQPAIAASDPYNRLLSHQSRWRLDAEVVRDTLLASCGLLDGSVGGESVRPYQPAGYWSYLNFPQREWHNGQGAELYRRGLYTHWQRQYLHPSLLAFDAPSREECTADRPRSNTPLQALVLLNDPTYVEAARALAFDTLEAAEGDQARIAWAIRAVLARPPRPQELPILIELLDKHRREFAADIDSAKQLLAVGDLRVPDELDAPELAAWTSVARTLLNLHESLTRN